MESKNGYVIVFKNSEQNPHQFMINLFGSEQGLTKDLKKLTSDGVKIIATRFGLDYEDVCNLRKNTQKILGGHWKNLGLDEYHNKGEMKPRLYYILERAETKEEISRRLAVFLKRFTDRYSDFLREVCASERFQNPNQLKC